MAVHEVSTTQLEPWNSLHGKVVLVTGASSGLGREFCLDLAKAGCKIIAAARRIDRLQTLCDEINGINASSFSFDVAANDPRAVAVELDVSAAGKSIEKCVKTAWDSFGFIDALVNNAGIRGAVKSCLDLCEEEWDEVMRTNLKGCWLVSTYVGILMRDTKRGGSIINHSSIAGLDRAHLPGALAYSASKTAMNTLTKITDAVIKKEWLKNVVFKISPLRTLGTSDPALTTLVRYLVHDSSRYVSGNIYIVDAGVTLPGLPIFSSL